MAGAQPVARARRDCGPGRGACEGALTHPRPPGCGPRRHARRQGFPAVARASRGLDPADLSRPHDPRRPRLQHPRASLISDIPHAHVCGGRGRCSTCRIRILGGAAGSRPRAPRSRRCSSGCMQARRSGFLSAPSDQRSGVRAAALPIRDNARRLSSRSRQFGRRALSGHYVRRHAWIESAGRDAPAIDTVFIINQFLDAVSHAVLDAAASPTRCSATGSWRCSA